VIGRLPGVMSMAEAAPRRSAARRGIRVVLVDDHELVRRGLREVLAEVGGISVVGEAGTLKEGLRRIGAHHPDVVLTDVRLPDGSGIELCRQVAQTDATVRVICVTSVDDPEVVHSAILAGACGYLLKEIRGAALADGVRRVAAGQCLLDPAVTGQVFERLRNPEAVAPELAVLTPQERRILELIIDGHTNREIGTVLNVSEQTVKNHVTSLLAKLNVTRRTQAAVLGARLRQHAGDR
jgi:two-component system, NarL family, response regulator DevR